MTWPSGLIQYKMTLHSFRTGVVYSCALAIQGKLLNGWRKLQYSSLRETCELELLVWSTVLVSWNKQLLFNSICANIPTVLLLEVLGRPPLDVGELVPWPTEIKLLDFGELLQVLVGVTVVSLQCFELVSEFQSVWKITRFFLGLMAFKRVRNCWNPQILLHL